MEARARYSDSVEDPEIVSCFLALQVMGLEPKYTIKLVVERRSYGSPTQSESEEADSDRGPG